MLDYTAKMREVIEDICRRHGAFRHIDISRMLVCYSQTRRAGTHGTHATLMPLRFEGGEAETTVDGTRWRIPGSTGRYAASGFVGHDQSAYVPTGSPARGSDRKRSR